MADSKAKGFEEAEAASQAEEAAGKRQHQAAQNAIILTAQVADHAIQPLDLPEGGAAAVSVRNQNTPILIKVRSARLGTAPEIAPGDLAPPPKRARSVSPNTVQAPPVAATLRNFPVAAIGPPSLIGISSTISPNQNSARSRSKPISRSRSPRSRAYFFGSCFGGPTAAASSGKSPCPQVSSRKLQQSPSIRRVPSQSDLRKPGAQSIEAEKKALTVPDSTANNPAAASTLVAEATALSAGATPARSPSCRFSISITEAENAGRTEQSRPIEPGAISGAPASMSNVDGNNPGNSSGQQVQNAQAEELIAADKRADDEETRISETGASPIRGLRPNPGQIEGFQTHGRRGRSDYEDGDRRSPQPRVRERRQIERRPRWPHNNNYSPDPRGRRDRYASPVPPATATGIERLFDAIIGRGDYRQPEQAAPSRSPNRFQRSRPRSSPNRRVEQQPFDGQVETSRDPTSNNPGVAPSSSRDQAFSTHATKSPDSLNPGTSKRDQYSGDNPSDQAGNSRGQVNQSGTFVDARATLDVEEQRKANLLASDHRWVKKNPFREMKWRDIPKDPRVRGLPDPSFNPRPGDIIIRARKRSGLRLTDFYYYDNENYMEQGDQIIRAKFEYLPPGDKMYLWCRLYVYGPDGTYRYLDSTSERVGKFREEPRIDIKTFKDPARFDFSNERI